MLNLAPSDSHQNIRYDSDYPIIDNENETIPDDGQWYYHSYDWEISADDPLGTYDLLGSLRRSTDWEDVLEDTEDGMSTTSLGPDAWRQRVFTAWGQQEGDGTVRYHALVVGNGDGEPNTTYPFEDDEAIAAADVDRVKDSLAERAENWSHDRIRTLKNEQVSQVAIENAFEDIGAAMDADDVFLFFYSGHGTNPPPSIGLWWGNLTPSELFAMVDKYIPPGAHVITIVNACNSGVFVSHLLTGTGRVDTYAMTACEADQNVATSSWFFRWPWRGSLFAHHFCAAIEGDADLPPPDGSGNANGEISFNEIFDYVQPRVMSGSWPINMSPQRYPASGTNDIPVMKGAGASGIIPSIALHAPASDIAVVQGQIVEISWTDGDSDDDATILLAWDPDDIEQPWVVGDHTWIADAAGDPYYLSEDEDGADGHHAWSSSGVPVGTYVVWAVIYDGEHARYSRAPGRVTVTDEKGYLAINLGPAEAVAAGAKWQVDSGPWQDSGDTVTLTVGDHSVDYKDIAGWDAPAGETATIVKDQTTQLDSSYTQHTGSLKVTAEMGPGLMLDTNGRNGFVDMTDKYGDRVRVYLRDRVCKSVRQ